MAWYGPRGNCGCCGAGCRCFTAGETEPEDVYSSVDASEVVFTITNCDASIDAWYSYFASPLDRRWVQLQVNSFDDVEGTYSFPIVTSEFLGQTLCYPTPQSPWVKVDTGLLIVYQLDLGSRSCFATEYNDDGLGCPGGLGTSSPATVGLKLEYLGQPLGATNPNGPHSMRVRFSHGPNEFVRRFESYYELPYDVRTDENQCGTSNIRYYDTTVSTGCALPSTITGEGSTAETV